MANGYAIANINLGFTHPEKYENNFNKNIKIRARTVHSSYRSNA